MHILFILKFFYIFYSFSKKLTYILLILKKINIYFIHSHKKT